ncbi:MAG TPA: hypothetical protein VHA54_08590 [Solirubrobacterales bacterium]|nr:hypothetical protein [Solirubrobacterales bacterium]
MATSSAALLSIFAVGAMLLASAAAASDPCPNAGIRAAQRSGFLPDCRAYELASPAEEAGSVVETLATVQSDASGDKLAFSSPGALTEAPTMSAYGAYYLASRAAGGWSTSPLDLPQLTATKQTGTPTYFLSSDFAKAVQFSPYAFAPGAVEGGGNIYLTDFRTGTHSLIAATDDFRLASELAGYERGARRFAATADLSHFVFVTSAQLLPQAAASQLNVYEWVNGQLRLVNYLPDGSPASEQSGIGATARNGRVMSDDGTKVYFESGGFPETALYLRLNGQTTIPISVSQRPGDPDTPRAARLGGISADGDVVYLMSTAPLTPDAPENNGGGGGGSLYRYDLSSGDLIDLTPLSDPADYDPNVAKVSEVSDDGSTVFFTSWANLTGEGISYQPNFYVWRQGQLRLIGTLPEAGGPPTTGLSPDGRYLAFTTTSRSLGNADTSSSRCQLNASEPGACSEVYLYDVVQDRLQCISCTPVDGQPGDALLTGAGTGLSEHAAQTVFDDGRVFFTSQAALVPADVNGTKDVYEWNGDHAELISSGKEPVNSVLADTSAGAASVFFTTSQRLVQADVDTDVDVYSARVGGGIEAQNEPPLPRRDCHGEACQGELGQPQRGAEIGSAGLAQGERRPRRGHSRKDARVRLRAAPSASKGALQVFATVRSGGRLSLSGKAIETTERRVRAAGTYELSARLKPGAKSRLRRRGELRITATVAFVPSRGARSVATVSTKVEQGGAK